MKNSLCHFNCFITHKVLQSPQMGPNVFKQLGVIARGLLMLINRRGSFNGCISFDTTDCVYYRENGKKGNY